MQTVLEGHSASKFAWSFVIGWEGLSLYQVFEIIQIFLLGKKKDDIKNWK